MTAVLSALALAGIYHRLAEKYPTQINAGIDFFMPLDFNPSRTIVSLSRLVTEGRLIKRLQTRGGERWPVGGVGEAPRLPPPAVQAALASGVPRRTPRAPDGL